MNVKYETVHKNVLKEQAVVEIHGNELYRQEHFTPNGVNRRLVTVKQDSLDALNASMQRTRDGNSQIFYTMMYKDIDRVELIKKFWSRIRKSPEYDKLPKRFQDLELEQIRKVGPKSRFSEEKLFEGFIDHVSMERKHICKELDSFKEASKVLIEYWSHVIKQHPDFNKYAGEINDLQVAKVNLPNDSNSGDNLFVGVDKDVAGVVANELEMKNAKQLIASKMRKQLYYTEFKRVQAKGNNIIDENGEITESPSEPWLPEKNRVVQGDSRAYAFIGKGIANLFTKCTTHDPLMAAWQDDEELNRAATNMLNVYSDRYDFKSFDAENFDASTDPQLFNLAMDVIFNVVNKLGLKSVINIDEWKDHFLHGPTITTRGIFKRFSLPSGHIWTNLVGTITNHLRNIVQTAKLFGISVLNVLPILMSNLPRYVPLFMALGDDAVQLVDKDMSAEESSELDNLHGFGSNAMKTIITAGYFHFLQKGFDHNSKIYGYYPVSRALESILFQEYANQYTSALVSVNAIAVINNCKFNPLQADLISFCLDGDPKYRLGVNIGFKRLFKEASKTGSSLAKLLDREWDPKYAGKSYLEFGDGIKDTLALINTTAGKSSFKEVR